MLAQKTRLSTVLYGSYIGSKRFRPFLIDITALKISATEINRSPRVKAVHLNEVTILVIFFHNRALSRSVICILHGLFFVYWKKTGFRKIIIDY